MSLARNLSVVPQQTLSFKNRIINGDMRIDQRNAGAAITVNNTALYTVDRWMVEDGLPTGVLSAQQVTDAPAGFRNSLRVTATTGSGTAGAAEYSVITQHIEGFNINDIALGTSSAKPVTVSFWVKASVTGTYSCTIYNAATTRINPQPYTINAANTWEYKTVTFTGETTGVWESNNSRGIALNFYTTIGTNYQSTAGWNSSGKYGINGSTNAFVTTGNTFQITGVQLEVGSTATAFDYRPYGTELALCQRYCFIDTIAAGGAMGGSGGSVVIVGYKYPIKMRATPTISYLGNGNAGDGNSSQAIASLNSVYSTSSEVLILLNMAVALGANTRGCYIWGANMSFISEL